MVLIKISQTLARHLGGKLVNLLIKNFQSLWETDRRKSKELLEEKISWPITREKNGKVSKINNLKKLKVKL